MISKKDLDKLNECLYKLNIFFNLNLDEKYNLIKRCLECELSYKDMRDVIGTDKLKHSELQRFKSAFTNINFSNNKDFNNLDYTGKYNCIKRFHDGGMTYQEICLRLGIDYPTISNFKLFYKRYSVINESNDDEIKINNNNYDRYDVGLRFKLKSMSETVQIRCRETNNRYLEFGKPKENTTAHHIIPYSTCINLRDNSKTIEEFNYYEDLACNRRNGVDLPFSVHQAFHNKSFRDNDKYYDEFDVEDIPLFLSTSLRLMLNAMRVKTNDSIIKEFVLKTIELLREFCVNDKEFLDLLYKKVINKYDNDVNVWNYSKDVYDVIYKFMFKY